MISAFSGWVASQPSPGPDQLVDLVAARPSSAWRRRAPAAARTGASARRRAGASPASRTSRIARVAPLRERRIERDRSSPRTCQPSGSNRRRSRSIPPRQGNAGTWISSGIADAASSGRASQRPVSAVPKTSFSAIASMLDAAYGRSLTYCPSANPSPDGPLRPRTRPTGIDLEQQRRRAPRRRSPRGRRRAPCPPTR